MPDNKNDVIRFRVTEDERKRIQALADKRTNGNISSLLKGLIEQAEKEGEPMQETYTTEIFAILRKRGEDVKNVKVGEITLERREDHSVATPEEYNRIKRALLKFPPEKKGEYWRLQTAEGLRDKFGGYPAEFNVRFE